MGKSGYLHYQTQPLGTPAPIIWYENLPDHVKRLYKLRETPSQDPLAMVILAEVVCEAFTAWALEEQLKKKNVEQLWKALSAKKRLRRYQDICFEDTNKVYTALSGDLITEAPFWVKLKEHNGRRNALVHPDHNGSTAPTSPSPQEADESFNAVVDYIQHVHKILGTT
jgi:hypothetical protein